ncbi:hypothetical protein D3C85_1367320 [compost metagenome]
MSHFQGGHAADQGECHQTHGVEHQKQRAQVTHPARGEHGKHCRDGGQDQIFRVFDPGQRVVAEQHVAYRTAAQRRDASNQHHAKPVHATTPRRQGAGHGFGGDGDQVEHQQHGGDPCKKARSLLTFTMTTHPM